MIRVDHAGEYGAARIYAGPARGDGHAAPFAGEIARMAAQEERHLKTFDRLIWSVAYAPPC
jgi:3-demethoxyubiquinol 3-hydroxylase